jgi:hypothetical protein
MMERRKGVGVSTETSSTLDLRADTAEHRRVVAEVLEAEKRR